MAGVLLLHAWLAQHLQQAGLGDGGKPPPPPIDVAFVQELAVTATPPAAAAPRPVAPARAVVAQAAASAASATPPASAPQPPASAVVAAASAVAVPVLPASAAGVQAQAQAQASVPAQATGASGPVVASLNVLPAASAPAPAPVPFDWPPSTRLDYDLEGSYRGPISGDARVEWRRQGERYQVRVSLSVSLLDLRLISDGVLTPEGLSPRRYDQETDVPLRGVRRDTVLFAPDAITLVNGQSAAPVTGVQDSASQFVQMTWLFLTHPERLRVGEVVQFPLALPRRVGVWTYDVVGHEELHLPFGNVPAFHLKPRPSSSKPAELTVEMWMAPGLQSLPVKLHFRRDEDTYFDLTLKKPPMQAAPAAGR